MSPAPLRPCVPAGEAEGVAAAARRTRACGRAPWVAMAGLALAIAAPPAALAASPPQNMRGTSQAERVGHHDANNIRTRYWNYGMVGDYPNDPQLRNPTRFYAPRRIELGLRAGGLN